jgi:hypothetical protein
MLHAFWYSLYTSSITTKTQLFCNNTVHHFTSEHYVAVKNRTRHCSASCIPKLSDFRSSSVPELWLHITLQHARKVENRTRPIRPISFWDHKFALVCLHILTLFLLLCYACTSCLLSVFGDRIRSLCLSSHRSPHLSSCDVYLWGTLRDKQHDDNSHTDCDEGKKKIQRFQFCHKKFDVQWLCCVYDARLQHERISSTVPKNGE